VREPEKGVTAIKKRNIVILSRTQPLGQLLTRDLDLGEMHLEGGLEEVY